LAPSGAGLLILKLFWRQKARVVLRLKISGMIVNYGQKSFRTFPPGAIVIKLFLSVVYGF
jgi:hypothetical protein